jgi:nitric oxide reductase NorQ protein
MVAVVQQVSPLPYWRPLGDERQVFETAFTQQLPLMLKGPTGCGKSRFVEHMAARLGRPVVTVACHDETSAVDLVGRWLVQGGDTVWQDGPATRAVRQGAVLYLDEIAEARPDVVVVMHALADHRRTLVVERKDEVVRAAPGFMLVASFNPGYQRGSKELKPSTRQRFVELFFDHPPQDVEREVLKAESGVDDGQAKRLTLLAKKLRALDDLGLAEAPSTRLLVNAGRLMRAGIAPRRACEIAIVSPLTDDTEVRKALVDLVALAF